jgi:hypothetical protein
MISTFTTPLGDRVSKITRVDGSVMTVIVPKGGAYEYSGFRWLYPWIYDRDVDIETLPTTKSGRLNKPVAFMPIEG